MKYYTSVKMKKKKQAQPQVDEKKMDIGYSQHNSEARSKKHECGVMEASTVVSGRGATRMEKRGTLGISHIPTHHLEVLHTLVGLVLPPYFQAGLGEASTLHLCSGLMNICLQTCPRREHLHRRHKLETLFSHSWLWQSCQTTSARWGRLCHSGYLTFEVPGLLESGQRAWLPSGQVGSLFQKTQEDGNEGSTHRTPTGSVGSVGPHHRLRILPESGVSQSH